MKFWEKKQYKWEVLIILWLAFFFNQGDRQIFNVVLPLIRDDLQLTEATLGLIASIFTAVLALFVPFGGLFGDMFSKKWICTISVLFWSVATMFTGLSTLVIHLIFTRSIAMAGGEAVFGPANYALISDYHTDTRSKALSIHQTSSYLGVIISGFLAGWIGEKYGWRTSFYMFGTAGILLGIIMIFRLKDLKTPELKKQKTVKKFPVKDLVTLFRTPTAFLLILGFAGMIFVYIGYLTWMPTYLHENFDQTLAKAGLNSMIYTHIAAAVGVILSGWLSDKFVVKNKNSRIKIQFIGLALTAPFILLLAKVNTLAATYTGLLGYGFFKGIYDANIYASLYDVIPAKIKSSASGLMIMSGFLVGSFSPYYLGKIKPLTGLEHGFLLLAIVSAVASLFLFAAFKFTFKNDYKINYSV